MNRDELRLMQQNIQTKLKYWDKLKTERAAVVQSSHISLYFTAFLAYMTGLEPSLVRAVLIMFLFDQAVDIVICHLRFCRIFKLGLNAKVEFLTLLAESLNKDLVSHIQVLETKSIGEMEKQCIAEKWRVMCDYEQKFML